ncbi:hypothetical protein ABZ532_20535 [Streptomyces sp. NPDC019396]|uniref:hypothetical protein n=1 Tax=Streptomyces sp. NPDC019396 TaxID=3154687 RepID=UPI0033E35BC9
MRRGLFTVAFATGCLAALLGVTGCMPGEGGESGAPSTERTTADPSQVAEMNKLVEGAESAVADAESAAAEDR